MNRRVQVVAALIAEPGSRDRFLVQQRLEGKSRGGLWEFPGGKVESGETEEEALVREGEEELGVALSVGRKLWSTVHVYPDLTVSLSLFEATVGRGTPRCLGAQALRYASPEQMRGLPFCEADLPLIEALASGDLQPVG